MQASMPDPCPDTVVLFLMQVAPVPVSVFAQQISQLSLDAEPPPLSLNLSHLPRFTHFLCVSPHSTPMLYECHVCSPCGPVSTSACVLLVFPS